MMIRKATLADADQVWRVIGPVFRAGETYAIEPDISREHALAYWLGSDRHTFVYDSGGSVLGTYYIRANQAGGGKHVCNCGYITAPGESGKGIARQMHLHSLAQAKQHGYRAMQFNFVISSNERAVRLWQSLDFAIVGTLPGAFLHPRLGLVDAYVMYRRL
ncbi:N-acetyltransferase family protein [Aestuariivirga sp.]|uniref:GNAT family N-acetyltransferase n=1 Tax=Aestuariivirga sp. TaxID=2650926 RepID=UPI00391A70F8